MQSRCGRSGTGPGREEGEVALGTHQVYKHRARVRVQLPADVCGAEVLLRFVPRFAGTGPDRDRAPRTRGPPGTRRSCTGSPGKSRRPIPPHRLIVCSAEDDASDTLQSKFGPIGGGRYRGGVIPDRNAR